MKKFSIHRKHIERVTLTGKGDEARKAMFDYCQHNGFDMLYAGCHIIDAMHTDMSRPKVVADREQIVRHDQPASKQPPKRRSRFGTIGCEE